MKDQTDRAHRDAPIIRIRGLGKRYGDHVVLRGIDFEVAYRGRLYPGAPRHRPVRVGDRDVKSQVCLAFNFTECNQTAEFADTPTGSSCAGYA